MKPWIHAENSAKRFGGKPDDYIEIHDFMDSSKAHFPDMRHRALLHSSFGIYLCEQVFGTLIRLEITGKMVQVRDIAEWHVIEDMGRIPTVQDYLEGMPMYDWLGGKPKKAKRKLKIDDLDTDFPPILPGTPEPPLEPGDWPSGIKVID